MAEISLGTKESAQKSRQATESVNQLAQMADALRASVSQFTVDVGDSKADSSSNPVDIVQQNQLMDQLKAVSKLMDAELNSESAPAKAKQERTHVESTIRSTMMFDQ